jgi:hypothetical protein
MDKYWSDTSEYSSEDEDETCVPEVWCQRELDYWDIEDLMEAHPPPPVVEYILKWTSFDIREAVVLPLRQDPSEVMDPISANNWHAFWQHGRENTEARFSFQDFDALGEYCSMLCEVVNGDVAPIRLRSCILHLLRAGNFI